MRIEDLRRGVVRDALQELNEEETTTAIGATRHERTAARTAHRNDRRERLVSIPAGDIEVRIPELRQDPLLPG